jgi:hypothetical protein
LIWFDALSQHLPWAAAPEEAAGAMFDCAAANDMPPASNAAAESTLSLPSFMTNPLLGPLAILPTWSNASMQQTFPAELLRKFHAVDN